MKWYFPTNQEKYLFCFFAHVPFNFEFFSIYSIIKKNFDGTFARATSLSIRKTSRGPQKKGSWANTLATPGLDRPSREDHWKKIVGY